MLNVLFINVQFELDLVEIFDSFLVLVARQFELVVDFGPLLLSVLERQILLLHVSFCDLFVVLEFVDERFLLFFDLHDRYELFRLFCPILFSLFQLDLRSVELLDRPVMPDLKLSVHIVHLVELAFELQPKLHFFLVIFIVLHVLTLQLQAEIPLILALSFQNFVVVSHRLHILLQHLLVVLQLQDLRFVKPLERVQLLVVLVCDLSNQDSVVSLAAVFKQDLVDLPDRCDYRVIFL